MAKQDLEVKIFQAVDYVKANLNAQIAAINAEKSDDLTLRTVDDAGFHFDTMDAQFPNEDPHVIFYPSSDLGETVADQSSERGVLGIELVTSDQGYADSGQVFRLLQRYRRAFREVLGANWQAFSVRKIVNFPDMKVQAQNGNFYAAAVRYEFQIVG